MKVFTNREFDGVYPVGTGAVVVAEDASQAAEFLRMAVSTPDSVKEEDMTELPIVCGKVRVLCDGDY